MFRFQETPENLFPLSFLRVFFFNCMFQVSNIIIRYLYTLHSLVTLHGDGSLFPFLFQFGFGKRKQMNQEPKKKTKIGQNDRQSLTSHLFKSLLLAFLVRACSF